METGYNDKPTRALPAQGLPFGSRPAPDLLPVPDAAEYVLWASDLVAARLDVLRDRLGGRHALIVATRSVARLYGHTLAAELIRSRDSGGAETLLLPDVSEDDTQALQTLLHAFLLAPAGSVVVALGGERCLGLVAAAASLSGNSYLFVPTTLKTQVQIGLRPLALSMGVGRPLTLMPRAEAVLLDPTLLASGDSQQWRAGIATLIAVALAGDADLFALLERRAADLSPTRLQQSSFLARRVMQQAQAAVIRADDAVGRFGRRIAPVLETQHAFDPGDALALDIAFSALLALALGRLRGREVSRIMALLRSFDLPIVNEALGADSLRAVLHRLSESGQGLTIPRGIGRVSVVHAERALDEVLIGQLCETLAGTNASGVELGEAASLDAVPSVAAELAPRKRATDHRSLDETRFALDVMIELDGDELRASACVAERLQVLRRARTRVKNGASGGRSVVDQAVRLVDGLLGEGVPRRVALVSAEPALELTADENPVAAQPDRLADGGWRSAFRCRWPAVRLLVLSRVDAIARTYGTLDAHQGGHATVLIGASGARLSIASRAGGAIAPALPYGDAVSETGILDLARYLHDRQELPDQAIDWPAFVAAYREGQPWALSAAGRCASRLGAAAANWLDAYDVRRLTIAGRAAVDLGAAFKAQVIMAANRERPSPPEAWERIIALGHDDSASERGALLALADEPGEPDA
ncbi:MAG: hypothetical protein AAF515_10650 [Pseudomonadota bacterium]